MPIFDLNGKKYDVEDKYLDAFSKQNPDAYAIEEREGKRYKVRAKDYGNFRTHFDKPQQKAVHQSEDDAVFETNAERFRNGQPIERVTTQNVIDANPELGLQTNAVQPEVDQTQQYIMNNKPTIFGGKKKSLMDVPLNVSTDAIEGGENLEKLSERARIAEHNMKDPFVQKARTEADVRGLASEIDGLLEKSVQEERASVGGSAFMPAGARGRAYTEANKERVKDVTDLSSAKRLLDQSQYIIDAAKRGDTGILKDTWQGFKDSLEAEDFTFGLADAASSASILDAIKKVENGEELTETEDKLLRASAINMATQYYYANDLNRAYKAGQVSAESVPFMLEMAINPISSLGKASAKTLLNYGLKSYAKQVGKGLAKGAAAGTGMALTTGLGRVAAGTTDRLAEGYNYGVDFDGNLYAEKKEDAMGVGEAVARSLASTAIENQSEMIFNAFKGFGGFMKGVQDVLPGGVNKFFDMLSHNKVADAYRYIKNSPVFRNYLVKDIRNATQIGGLGEEYLEEVYNNIANAAIGEMKWEDVVSLDKNIDTLLGLAPTQVMFGLLGLGGAGAMRYQTRKTLEDLQATMNEQQRKDLEGLLDMGLDAKEVDVRGFIRNVMQNESYTIENKRDLIKAAYNVAKQNGIDELTEADTIDKVNAENALIDSVTDPSTGIYTEITATLPDAKEGAIEVPGYVVGWLGEGEKRQPIFVQEGMDNTYENRRVLKPGQWSEEAVQQMPAEEVKAINEEMIREEAAQQAEQEAKYAPEVINAQMQQGVPFDTPNAQIIPVAPMPEGNGWIVEEYALDTNNKVAKTPIVRELTNDEYRDMLQAQLNAEEAAQEQISAEEQAAAPEVVEEVQPNQPTEEVRPIVEGVANQQQAEQPKQPTLEDVVATLPKTKKDEIDYKAMTPQQQYQYTSITESPEVALEDLQADITAGQEEIAKTQEQLTKARGGQRAELRDKIKKLTAAQNELQSFYDSVLPKQETQSEEQVVEPVKYAAEEIVSEEKPVVVETEKAKKANKPRLTNRKKQKQSEFTDEELQPMDALEFAAHNLAVGNVSITTESFKKETGYGEAERKKFMGLLRTPEKGGLTIEEAAEKLVSLDNEENGRFFGGDTQAARNTIIELLGYEKWGDVTGLIKNNRLAERKKREEAEYAEYEAYLMEELHVTPEEYELLKEAEEQRISELYDVIEEVDAIFAEAELERQNNQEYEQGRNVEGNQGQSELLSEARTGDLGGNQRDESQRGTSEVGGTSEYNSETPQESTSGSEVDSFIERAKEWEAKTGVGVRFAYSLDEVTNEEARDQLSNGVTVAGWYEKSTGEVVMYLPNITSLEEVDKTYVHEVVVHKGLPSLLGEKYDSFLDEVWNMMSVFDKAKYINYPGVASETTDTARQRAAADEYIANTFESIDVEESAWGRITDLIKRFLKAIGLEPRMTNADIANAVKASYANLKSGAEGNVSGEGTKFRAKWRKGQLDKASRTIRRWLENNTRGKSFEIELPKATLDKVRKAMGRDFESHNITSNGIVHALKNHGENGLKLTGISIPLSKEDVELIPYIMTSPDRVEKASTDASGRESVRFYKDLSNGYVVVVEKEYKNSPDDMETITMWAELSSKATNAQQNAAPDTHVRNAILSIDIAKIRKDAEDAIEEDENLKEKTSFRVVKDKNGNKSLVGLHNISEAKLKKAIKQGGLANPSMAVIDMDKQSHVDYGDITLVAPSSLVDKKTGKNIGTYTADAWTPIYPQVEKQMSKPGAKEYSKDLEQVPSELRSKVRLYFNAYLEDGNTSGALNYWFLHDTGKNPPLLTSQSNDYTNEELDAIEAISNAGYYSGLNEEEKQKVLELFIEKQGGKDVFEKNIADRIETMKKNLQRPDIKSFIKKNVEQTLQGIEEYGYDYEQVSNFYANAQRAINNRGKIDEFRTFRNAQDIVNNEGLQGEFDKWLSEKEEQFGVEEYIFVGYNNNGDRKHIPNTLENASRIMKKEGRAGATGLYGFNHFVATLAPNAGSLVQIRKKKGNLSSQEEYKEFVDKWGSVYHDLAEVLRGDYDGYSDVGYYRLEEMPTVKNPKEYVKKEYGIDLSDEFMQKYNDFVSAIKNYFPARYFETKFERPVYLNEFAAAVVPQGTSKDVVDALTEAGLPVEKYESGNNEARMAAVDKVSSEIGGIRFRISEKGKQIQAEVDKFTSKYNSKPVELIDPEMTDEEIEDAIDWQQTAKDLKAYIKESKSMGGYVGELDKILIFVENMKLERMEEAMFHENLHPFVDGGEYDHLLNKLYENGKDDEALSRARRFSDREPKAKRPLEFFNYAVSYGQVNGDLDDVLKYFDKEEQAELLNLLKENGYDYYQEQEGRRGNAVLDGLPRGEENAERVLQHQEGGQESDGRVSSESQEEKLSPTERKARLNELFKKVADMGLQGVLGNKEYTSLMVDIYKALPEEVRAEIAEDALRLYGGSVAPAVSDYIGPKSKNSIMDKVVTIVREALRKIGFDLDLNANEVRYMAWRSKKPLDKNNMFEVAEDIDMRYRLKVGEYDGSPTPDGGGTRFSVKSKPKTKAELKEEVRDLKEDVRGLKDEVRDLKKQVNTLRSGNKYEWEKKQRAIVSFIKGRLTKEAGSVLGKTRLDQLLTLVNKASTATDLHKPLQFIEQVINDASIEHAASKMDKLIKTKLQGETNRGVAKGVVVDETTRRLFDSIRGTFKDLIVTSIDSELRSVRGEILRFGKEINALPEDDVQGRAILTARQDALKERRKELEKEQEELQRHNVTETKESLERRHDELVEAMDAHIEGEGVWTQEMQDEYDSIPLRLKLAEIRESQSQLDAILADAIMTRRNAYKNNGETRKKMLAEADVIESNYTIAQEELIRLMNEVSDELNAIIKEGKSRLAKRKQALAERRIAIVTMGISAVKDKKIKDPNAILSRKEKFDKWFDNSWLKSVSDFMTAPLNSFNFMLKYIDRNHTIGEGELYNHFMKSEEGALEANNRLYDGLKAYNTAIEEKAKEIFGKDIESVMKDSGKEYTDKVYKQYMYDSSSHKEGEMYPISITKGQALYVWLTWRQDDGRAKLVADGWNDQSIEEIEALIGEDYIKFGEWITDEFFPMLREEKYNKTHIDMFGTSMAKREHYFPFKVQSEDIQEKGEMGESYSGMPSTITGNIIKRTINKSRIKTDQNAFDLLYKYGNDMETWNAMAKLRQDLNFLHSSKAFRNYLEANSKGLFDKFMKAAEVAVKAYNNGEKDAINDFFAKLNRTWAGTNIGFRLNTAMKQILSYPAFMAYSGNLKYQGYLMKYMLNWVGNYKWAKENLPAFRNRVESGDMGMTGMTDPSFDLGKVINKFGEWGMIPNQLVDALTCAAGARSVYDFEYNRAIKAGMSEEEAKNIAQYNAEVAFNETQQSSRDEFVSPTQVSRNVLIKSMMNYQNSNVGYQRLGNEGLLEIMRAKHVYEQDIKNGMSEDEAKKKVANSVIRGTRKMMIAFTILPGLWYLGGRGIVGITAPLISSLFGGGDDDEPYLDDEAKEDLMLSMALGIIAGTTGGQAIASVVQGREYEPMAYVKEFTKIIADAVKDGLNLNTTKNIALKMAKFGGVNVETFENIYIGVEHAIRTGNFDLVDFMFLINLPPSQRKKMAEELYSDMPFMEYAEKVSRAQKLFDDYRKNLPYAKGDKNGSKTNAIKKQYVIENLSDDKQDKLEKEKEFKKLKREYNSSEDKSEWLEDHPEYKQMEKDFNTQEVTKEVNQEAKKLK